MRLVLSEAEQSQLAETARLLLSPLDEPVGPWRANVLRHLSRLLDTPMGGFILPTAEPPPYTLHNLPDAFAREYFETFHAVDRGVTAVRQLGPSIWSTRMLVESTGISLEEGWFGTPVYREFYSRYGIQEGMGFVVPVTEPPLLEYAPGVVTPEPAVETLGAVLTCFHDEFGTDACGERGLAKLRLLLPALEAGVAGRVRLGWMRRTLHEAFDTVQDGLQVRADDGRLLHANAALDAMLQTDPERDRIDAATERVCGALRGMLGAWSNGAATAALEAVSSEVTTARARYRVRGQFVSGGSFAAGRTIIVSVARLTPLPPGLDELQERWGLSPQEARVALLLAQGCSNTRVAAELQLSGTTARHYTEAVFLKLGVHSRAEAARRILVG
jgi:DNA-binding CsgD family transcriptional regulator